MSAAGEKKLTLSVPPTRPRDPAEEIERSAGREKMKRERAQLMNTVVAYVIKGSTTGERKERMREAFEASGIMVSLIEIEIEKRERERAKL